MPNHVEGAKESRLKPFHFRAEVRSGGQSPLIINGGTLSDKQLNHSEIRENERFDQNNIKR